MSNILLLVSEGDTRMLRGLSQLSKNDVECIWTEVSFYIRCQMNLQKGVNLSGLGTFTFSLQNFNTGHGFIKVHHPIFILAGKLSQSLGLHQVRWLAEAAHVPVVPLNFAAVSQQTPYSRDVVEGCVRETLAALHRALASERHIFLPFKGIGVLSFRNNKVQMKFSRDFINTISGTHQTLKDSSLRAGSSVSLSSGDVTELQRPQAACHVSLPAIGFSQMDNKGISKEGGNVLPSGDQRNKKEVPQQRESKSNQSLQMKAVGLTEELNPIPPAEPSSSVLHEEPPKLDQHLRNVSCSGQILAEQQELQVHVQAHGNILLLKEQLRDEQEMKQELAKLTERREQAKKVAAFNLLMSRREKSCCFDCPRSFIFPARPVTPPKRIQQHRYRSDLRSQMERRQQLEAQDQQYRLLTERLDQMQLIQEGLSSSVEDKIVTSCPECPPDKPRPNRCETAIRRAENRKRAQKLFHANFSVATQRKREEIQNHQLQLEKEKEMLKHTKTQLMQDNINRFEKKRAFRKSLEDDWSRSVELKHKREEEERRFLSSKNANAAGGVKGGPPTEEKPAYGRTRVTLQLIAGRETFSKDLENTVGFKTSFFKKKVSRSKEL
ncbi:hypothetical protein CCH79_00004955 [Gambusia affinis]|uniref:CCDC81 HU domain-containing protein n=1 Tax=Gambusia affinis TaxID=33528 RepID=A0A315V6Y7_GAMAF|nr:hypothetical protein CCH79_00004955 [Gambusia affinis]